MIFIETEKKKLFSFDRNYSAIVNYTKPAKFKELEKISKSEENFINVGSNLSYSPLSFSKKSISISLNRFNRILYFVISFFFEYIISYYAQMQILVRFL